MNSQLSFTLCQWNVIETCHRTLWVGTSHGWSMKANLLNSWCNQSTSYKKHHCVIVAFRNYDLIFFTEKEHSFFRLENALSAWREDWCEMFSKNCSDTCHWRASNVKTETGHSSWQWLKIILQVITDKKKLQTKKKITDKKKLQTKKITDKTNIWQLSLLFLVDYSLARER